MLIQFKFSNYKSFYDETIFDLSATEIKEHPHHVVQIGNEKILKTAAIFGANASGKTNFYRALRYMISYVCNSFGYGGENESSNVARIPDPFLFDARSKMKNSEFSIYFTIPNDEKIYNYGFCVNKEEVAEEWLSSQAPTKHNSSSLIFDRSNNSNDGKPDLSGIPQKYHNNILVSLQKETLILSLGAKLKVEPLNKIYNWFSNIILLDFGDPFENASLSRIMPHDLPKPEVRKDVVDYLDSFDHGIVDFEIKKVGEDRATGRDIYDIRTLHNASGMDKPVSIPFPCEAAGTQKMFALYPPLRHTLESGGVLFIDEFNDRLHPLLGRSIIQLFLDPERNPNNAQLMIITHDTCLLSQNLLRRDEIWIVDKEKDEKSQLYSLVDFKGEADPEIPKDKNYEIDYLEGKYRGTPDLEGIHLEVK